MAQKEIAAGGFARSARPRRRGYTSAGVFTRRDLRSHSARAPDRFICELGGQGIAGSVDKKSVLPNHAGALGRSECGARCRKLLIHKLLEIVLHGENSRSGW